jgi:hypothetical protein
MTACLAVANSAQLSLSEGSGVKGSCTDGKPCLLNSCLHAASYVGHSKSQPPRVTTAKKSRNYSSRLHFPALPVHSQSNCPLLAGLEP